MLISIDRAREWLKQTAQNEKRRFVKCLSKSESFQTLQNLFKKKVPQIPAQELPGRLESHIQHLELDERLEEEEPSLFESVEFKELSQLRKNKEDVSIPVSRGILTSLFGPRKELSAENFDSTVEYLSAFMDETLQESNPLNENTKASLKEAMERKELIDSLISDNEVDLKEIAHTLTEDVQETTLDKPFIYFGELSVRRALELPFFDLFLKNELPEEFYELIHADSEKLTEKVQQYLLKSFQDRGWITDGLFEKKEQIENILKNIFNKTSHAISSVLPTSWYNAVAQSLKEDVLELALGVKPTNGSKRIGEDLCNNMMEQGLQNALESAIKDIFEQSRGFINTKLDDVVGGIADNLPKTLLQFASAGNVNISPQERFWIEIRKQENGKGSIYFFTHDLVDGFDHIPLVFSDIEPEKLSEQFFNDLFFRLLSYQAWPEKEGVSYSLTDVHELLVELIGKGEDDPNEDHIYPSSGPIRENTADYLKRYVHHHYKGQELDFHSLYNFDLPYQLLQDFWPEIEQNPALLEDSSLRSELGVIVEQLSEMGRLLYEKEELDAQERKKLTATLNEVRLTLEEYEKSVQIKSSVHSMVVPDELWLIFEKLRKENTLLSPTNIEDLKEIFVSVLGEDLEETIDLLIKEMLPRVEIENTKVHPKDRPWSEVFKLGEIKKFIRELRSMRLSLLHTYRVYARISSAIKFFFEFSVFSSLLEALIRICIPQINLLLPFSVTHLAKAMVLFGPGILAKIVPKEVWNVLSSIFGLVYDVIGHVMRRFKLLILGAVFRRVLGDTQVKDANEAVRKTLQKLTKTGEISFDLMQAESIEKPFTILKSPPIEEIELIEQEEGDLELPRPYQVDLTPSNLKNELSKWCRDLETFKNCKENHFQGVKEQRALFFLNAQLRSLPIPGSEGGELWDRVEEPMQMIELLHILCCSLRQKERCTPEEATERTVSVYTLYTIIDKLARQCPQAYLTDEFKANGLSFARWMSSPLLQVFNIKTYHKIHQIAAYFEFKKGKEKPQGMHSFEKCSEEELNEYQRERLFNFTSCSKIFPFQQLQSTDIFSTKNATQVIELHNGGLRFSKDFAYYRSLLTKKEIIEKIERLGAQNSSEFEKMNILFGNFEEILPQAYSYLRLVHLMALQMVEKDVEEYKTHEFPDGILRLELEHQEVEKEENGFFSKVVKRAKEIGHKVSGSIFKSHVFATNISFFPTQIHGSEKVAKRKARHLRGADLFSSKFEYGHCEFLKWITDPSKRSQSQILVEGPWDLGDLKHKERAILEMLNAYEADQVVRALNFFDENKMLLSLPKFRFLFSLLINQSSALDMQLSQRAETIESFGRIFQGILDYFYSQEDMGTCLYLSQVGFEMTVQCQRFKEDAKSFFPDFNLFIQTKIAPVFRSKEISKRSFQDFEDGLILCYLYIVSTYCYVDPSMLSEEQRRGMILSIARLAYSKTPAKWVDSKLNVAIKSLDVIYLWEPYIKEALLRDPALRSEVIEGILEDAGIASQEGEEWEGDFPVYSKGDLRVDLEDFPLSSKPEIDIRAQVKDLGVELTDEVKLSDSSYSYPKENITVSVRGDHLTVKKELDGTIYRLLSKKEIDHQSFYLEENESLWIEDEEEEAPLVLQMRQTKITARHFMELEGESYICICSEKEFNGIFLEKVREEEKNGTLALLNWFQLPSTIDLFKEGSDLKRIEFAPLELSFEVVEEEGIKRALCCEGKFPGFYMAPRQDKMALRKYADSLLIENNEGEQKLLIAAQSFKQLVGVFLMKQIGGINTSPFIDSTVKGILESSDPQKGCVFEYSITDKDKLETKDAKALFYLVFFHFSHGRFKESMHYFSQLEVLGHEEQFSLELLSSMDQILIPLLMSQHPQAEQLFLKLSALREKNELLNRTQREFSQLDLLRYMAVQVKYFRYLKRVQTGSYAYLELDDNDGGVRELFLIRSIERLSKKTIQNQFPSLFKGSFDEEGIEGLLKKLGVDELAGHLLMMPLISHRHRELRSKFKDGNHWSRKTEGLFLNALFGEESKLLDLQKVNKIFNDPIEKTSLVLKVFSAYQKTMERSYYSSKDKEEFDFNKILDGFVHNNKDFERGTTPLTLDCLTPKWISVHFLYLYRLALDKIPPDWKGLEGKEALFNTHKKAFHYYFPMLSGKIHDKEFRFLFNVLEMVSRGSSLFTSYAEPDRLDELMKQMASLEEEAAKSAKEKLELILNSLFQQSSKWAFKNAFWKMTGLHGSNAPKVVLEIGQKTAKFVLNKGFKILLNKILRTPVNVVNAVSGIYQAVKSVYREETSVIVSEKQKKCLELKNRELDPSLKEKMNLREEGINQCMQELLDKYFDIEDVEIQREEVQSYENLDEEFNQSIRDYNSRPNVIETKYILKEGMNGEDLWKDLKKIQTEVNGWLKMEREAIKRFANHNFKQEKTEEEQILEQLVRGSEKRIPLTFEEISKAFIQQRDSELKGRSKMGDGQLEQLKEYLFLYLVLASRWNLLFEQMNKGASLEVLAAELDRRRVYDFNDIPELLVLSNLKFEATTKKMMRDNPFKQVKEVLLNKDGHQNQISQQIMGSGKTWCFFPFLHFWFGDGEKLSLSVSPAAVAKANASTISGQAQKVFGQLSHWISVIRGGNWSEDLAFAIYYTIEGARLRGDLISMTKEQIQALELVYLEMEFSIKGLFSKPVGGREIKNTKEYLRRALSVIRESGIEGTDEIQKASDHSKELNYPLGKRQFLEKRFIKVMGEVLLHLAGTEELKLYLSIVTEKPSPLPFEEYKKVLAILAPCLVEKMPLFKEVFNECKKKIEEEQSFKIELLKKKVNDALIEYISTASKQTPTFISKSAKCKEIDMVRGMLLVLNPMSLKETIHVHFNASNQENNGEQAKPSEGNNNTQEDSTIRSPFEAFVKTVLMLLHDRLKEKQLDKLIAYLKERALKRSEKELCKRNKTVEARFFKKYCKEDDKEYKLFTFEEKDKKEVYRLLNSHDEVIVFYAVHVLWKEFFYFGWNLSSNSYNFLTQGAGNVGGTGEKIHMGRYLQGTHLVDNPGNSGESVSTMERKCFDIVILEQESPRAVLTEIIELFFENDPSCLVSIDLGAYFNGITDEDVAKVFMEKVVANREDLKGVVFYKDGLMMMQEGRNGLIPLEQTKIKPNQRISNYSQARCYALHIDQDPKARAVITIAEDTTFSDFAQAVYRLREVNKEQDFIIALLGRVRDRMKPQDEIPTVQEIISYLRSNENGQSDVNSYEGDKQQLYNVIRRALLDKAEFAVKSKTATDLICDYYKIFVNPTIVDPSILFGNPLVEKNPVDIFVALRKKYFALIEKSKYFTENEKQLISLKLNEIGNGKYPPVVSVYLVKGEVDLQHLNDLNKETHLSMHNKLDIDVTEEQEMQMQMHQHQQQEELQVDKKIKPQVFYPWPKNLQPTLLEWLKVVSVPKKGAPVGKVLKNGFKTMINSIAQNMDLGEVPIFAMSNVLASIGTKASLAAVKFISKYLLTTNNMTFLDASNGCEIDPFGPYQVPALEMLVVKRPPNTKDKMPLAILIDQKEAQYWRERLDRDRAEKCRRDESVKIGIYDFSSGLVAEGFNKFENELEVKGFKELLVQVKFLFGAKDYNDSELDMLENWIKQDSSIAELNNKWKGTRAEKRINKLLGVDEQNVFETF